MKNRTDTESKDCPPNCKICNGSGEILQDDGSDGMGTFIDCECVIFGSHAIDAAMEAEIENTD